jgi:hypothetical protein
MLHPSLPKSLTPELLASWLQANAKEKFSEDRKIYYTDDELNEFKDKAVKSGIEINNLSSLKSTLSKSIEEGSEGYVLELPQTDGVKTLKARREYCEKEVEKGYRVETIKVYGVPSEETNCMDFFDIEGNIIPERFICKRNPRILRAICH